MRFRFFLTVIVVIIGTLVCAKMAEPQIQTNSNPSAEARLHAQAREFAKDVLSAGDKWSPKVADKCSWLISNLKAGSISLSDLGSPKRVMQINRTCHANDPPEVSMIIQ